MTTATVRAAAPQDLEAIKAIAVAAEMFTNEEVEFFDDMFSGWLDGTLDGHRWLVSTDENDAVVAGANYAPEPFSDRLWNLYFIAVDPLHQSNGIGADLIKQIEAELKAMSEELARVLLIETSSTDQYSRTRQFYARIGYVEEARVREFYGPADDKVIFWKSLAQ